MNEMIRIETKDEAVKARMAELYRKMHDPSPVLKPIGEYMVRSTEDRFRSQGPAPDGTPWAPLKKSTLKRKKHPKILTESGDLRGDIHYQLLDTHRVAIGPSSRIKYAAIHQLGGTIRRAAGTTTVRHRTDAKGNLMTTAQFGGKGLIFAKGSHRRVLSRVFDTSAHDITIPARPYLGVSAADSAKIVGIVNKYLAQRG